MTSLYEELSDRLVKDPSLARRGGPRADIGLLLFSERDDIFALWKAAAEVPGLERSESLCALRSAVERLRPLFGER